MTSSFVGTRSPPRAGIPYAGRLLRFRPRLRVERLAGGEPTLEGVPVRDLRLAALPAQVCEIPTDPRVEVHEAQADVLDLDAVVEDLPQVGVDRHADGRALVRLGLVDFHARIGGDLAYLCWQRGESQVAHWHSLEGGFA